MSNDDEKKNYNYMEKVLHDVNREFISLSAHEVKRNIRILESILKSIITKMKEIDPLFKAMHLRVLSNGNYYDSLKVRIRKTDEFDLDLLLGLPKYAQPVLTTTDIPGFVQLQLKNYDGWMGQPEAMPAFSTFGNLFDQDYFLDTEKVLQWMEDLVHKSLNEFPQRGSKRILTHGNEELEIIVHKNGPVLNLEISNSDMSISVDLITCFVFTPDKWPQTGFKANPVKSKPEFFIVPENPKGGDKKPISKYWGLSFEEQERALMNNKPTLKPTVKFLKKIRDNLNHSSISNYHIETAVLQIAERKDEKFWHNSLSHVFMTVLKEYKDMIKEGKIPYYWNVTHNLIDNINAETVRNMANRLTDIIIDIESKPDEPLTVAKYLLNSVEYSSFAMKEVSLH